MLIVALEVLVEWILWPLDLCVFIIFVKVIKFIEVGGQVGQISGIEVKHETLSWRLMGYERST